MILNSDICKKIKNQDKMKENYKEFMKNEHPISRQNKAYPKDIAALDKSSVLAKVNSQGSGRMKGKIPKLGEDKL